MSRSLESSPSNKEHHVQRSNESAPKGPQEEVSPRGVQEDTTEDIHSEATQDSKKKREAFSIGRRRDSVIGFVLFRGSAGKVRSRSYQFHLPLQFFLPLAASESRPSREVEAGRVFERQAEDKNA